MNLSDVHVVRDDAGNATDYVFIDPTGITHYPVPDRKSFTHAVSFSVVTLQELANLSNRTDEGMLA